MPFVDIKANFSIKDDKALLVKDKIGKLIEILPGKSEQWLMVEIEDQQRLYFGGSDDKALLVQVDLYGECATQSLNSFTFEISEYLKKELNVDKKRIYVRYLSTNYWGYNGENF